MHIADKTPSAIASGKTPNRLVQQYPHPFIATSRCEKMNGICNYLIINKFLVNCLRFITIFLFLKKWPDPRYQTNALLTSYVTTLIDAWLIAG